MQPRWNSRGWRISGRWAGMACGLLIVALGSLPGAYAGTFNVFGPEDFVRSTGSPTTVSRSFPAVAGSAYILHVDNGGSHQQFSRVKNAQIELNDRVVLNRNDFKKAPATLDKPVALKAQNHLAIDLNGDRGTGFTLTILGQDSVTPVIAITAPNQPVITNVPRPPVAVSYSDALSGVDTATLKIAVDGTTLAGCTVGAAAATCTPPALAAGNHTVTAQVKDRAGNLGTATFHFQLVLDTTPPTIAITSPNQPVINGNPIPTVAVSYSDAGTGVDTGTLKIAIDGTLLAGCKALAATATCPPPPTLTAGNHTVTAQIKDKAGNLGTASFHFQLVLDTTPPTIAITAPNQPVFNSNPIPTVAVSYSDSGSGVDTTTLKIAVDSTTLAGCTVGPSTATCPPPTLAAGNHTVTAQIKDKAGNLGTASFSFQLVLDTTPPVLSSLLPLEASYVSNGSPGITSNYSDADSGIDLASVRVFVDGTDRTAEAQIGPVGVTLVPASPLAEGPHTATFSVSDLRGNQAQASTHFSVDTQPPLLAVTEPSQPVLLGTGPLKIRVNFSDATSGVDPDRFRIELDGGDQGASCSESTSPATCSVPSVRPGNHQVTVRATDRAGNSAVASVSFAVVVDGDAPALAIISPSSPLLQGTTSPQIRAQYSDAVSGIDRSSVRVLVDGTDLTGTCQVGNSEVTCSPSALGRGMHEVSVQVADLSGNVAHASFDFALAFPLAIAFTAPAPDFLTGVAAVRVTGTVSPGATSVRVNGVPATLGSGSFAIDSLGLHDGINELVAVAQDAAGNTGTATVRVIADVTPPALGITFPADGAVISTPAVLVNGVVNDLTIGTVSDTRVTVTVNGVAASVVNRSFAAPGVPLQPGSNVLTAVATDRAGNQKTAEVHVTYQARTGVSSLQIVSGDGQSAPISTNLPAPLVVAATDAAGQPLPNTQVVFQIVRGNGVLEGGVRTAVVRTDAQGRASIHWTIGSRAGVGVDRVRVTAVGITGDVSLSATALTGAPAQIDVASGDNQRGALGSELPRPLFAVVTDSGHNPVPGTQITFRVLQGGGGLVEGAGTNSATVGTDDSGLASVRFVLGPAQGFDNNLVEAFFVGSPNLPATFMASGFLAGDPAQTGISGTVLDNQGAPVPGVTMRIRDAATTTTTDAEGKFQLAGVPVGQVFLIADATTATRPGEWASLEYEMFAIAGVNNTLQRPIYILPLDLPNGALVDETHGGRVNLPEAPGFALDIAPGSVTFPGGSRSGVVSATAVHADRIPMPPGAGMQPRLIVTIQPVGARFDPPAKITLPNVDGLTPGTVTELFSFDHDIGAFVSIGTGTVSEDGLQVQSDPGFGIVQAGWHCGTPPNGSGSSATLSIKITDPPDPTKPLVVAVDQTKDITSAGDPPLDAAYTWTIDDPSVATLTPSGTATCNGQTPVSLCPAATTCKTTVKGVSVGKTKAKARLKCCVSGVDSSEVSLDVIVLKMEVVAVGFVNDYPITEAATGNVIDQPDGSAPVWTKTSNPDKPVAYSKNTPPQMFAKFSVTPNDPTVISNVMIRAKSGGVVIGTASGLKIHDGVVDDSANTDGDVDGIGGGSPVPGSDSVKKLTPTFGWEFSLDGGATWASAGSSGPHKMYFTDGPPLIPPFKDINGTSYPQIVDLALDKATGYVNGSATIAQKITEGIDADINYAPALGCDGHPLNAYFSSGGCVCGVLADLLQGMLRTVGVDGTVLFKFAGPNATTWRRYTVGSTGDDFLTFRVVRAQHDSAPPNPHFTYHAVVLVGGRLYDASYGISYPSLNFDETANNSTPQQSRTDFINFTQSFSGFVCPH